MPEITPPRKFPIFAKTWPFLTISPVDFSLSVLGRVVFFPPLRTALACLKSTYHGGQMTLLVLGRTGRRQRRGGDEAPQRSMGVGPRKEAMAPQCLPPPTATCPPSESPVEIFNRLCGFHLTFMDGQATVGFGGGVGGGRVLLAPMRAFSGSLACLGNGPYHYGAFCDVEVCFRRNVEAPCVMPKKQSFVFTTAGLC